MAEWQEKGSLAEGLVITFDGVNQDEQDKLDMENFSRGLKTPAKEDPGGKAFARTAQMRGRAMTPMDAVRFGLAMLGALAGYLIAGALKLTGGAFTGLLAGGFALGFLLTYLVAAVRTKQAEPVARTTAESFRLTFSPAELVVEGQAIPRRALPLGEIDRFDGRGRLTVMRRDGGAVVLPCSLKSRYHEPLAGRLDELLGQARALGSVGDGAGEADLR